MPKHVFKKVVSRLSIRQGQHYGINFFLSDVELVTRVMVLGTTRGYEVW